MSIELTHISEQEFENILYGQMTPKMAAEYLKKENVSVRSFSNTLKNIYPSEDIRGRLNNFYMISQPGANASSVDKKIRNWLTDRNQPTDREDLYRIAFALELHEGALDYLLSLCSDYGIQYRDGKELVLTWFLRSGYGYREALEVYGNLPEAPGLESAECNVTSRVTHEIHSGLQYIHTLPELENYYMKNLNRFGHLHLRSYHYFERFLSQLVHPTTPLGDDPADYSIDAVMKTYLSMSVPSDRCRRNFSLVQKLIKQNWPNATALKNIRSHNADVPRKLLLILYIATENCIMSDRYSETDEEYATIEDRVNDHWWAINAMLNDCGMAGLDPRNAFDWLVLYAIAGDPEEAMSDRLEKVLEELYNN